MKKSTLVLGFLTLFLPLVSIGQYGITHFNKVDEHGNFPVELIQVSQDTLIYFSKSRQCNSLVINRIINDSIGQDIVNYGGLDRFRLKQYNGKWMCLAEQSYIEFFPGPTLSFIHEKDGEIILKLENEQRTQDTLVQYYFDFTFYSDSTLLAIPSKLYKYDGDELPISNNWYILDFEGIKIDSFAAPINDIQVLDRYANGYICADIDSVYFLDIDFNLIKSLDLYGISDFYEVNDTLILAQSSLNVNGINPLSYDKVSILENNNETVVDVHLSLDKEVYILEMSQIGEGERQIYRLSSDLFLESIINLFNSPLNVYHIAGNDSQMMTLGMDNHGFNSVNFEHFRINGASNEKEDVSISLNIDSIEVVGIDIQPYYDLTLHFGYEIENHSNETIDSLIVYSNTILHYFCEIYYDDYIKDPINPGEKLIVEGAKMSLGSLNDFDFCLYVPTVNGKPDLNPEDNKSCNYILDNNEITYMDELILYPNPVKDYLNISSETAIEEITIFNAQGQKVKTYKNTKSINMSSFDDGNYFLIIKDQDNNYHFEKVVKF